MNKYLLISVITVLLTAAGLSGCTYGGYMKLTVTVIDDLVPVEHKDDYENISGEPTTIGVYLCRQDKKFEHIYHFNLLCNISLGNSEGNNFTGSKTIKWIGKGTICVGYGPKYIDGLSVVSPTCPTSIRQGRKCSATVHHWRYIGPLPVESP